MALCIGLPSVRYAAHSSSMERAVAGVCGGEPGRGGERTDGEHALRDGGRRRSVGLRPRASFACHSCASARAAACRRGRGGRWGGGGHGWR